MSAITGGEWMRGCRSARGCVVRFVMLFACMLVLLLRCAGAASASSAWWHLNTISASPVASGGEGTVDLVVSNLGDAQTTGTVNGNVEEYVARGETKNFVVVSDTLPAGVVPHNAYAEGGGSSFAWLHERNIEEELEKAHKPRLCSVSGQTVRCAYAVPVRPFEQIIVAVCVTVEPGAGDGQNELTVSGGGVPGSVSRRALAFGAPGSGAFGVQSYELTAQEDGGAVTTQAGSHPFQLTSTFMLKTRSAPPSGKAKYPIVEPFAFTKDLHFHLPPGLIGNPTPLPKCSLVSFALEAGGGGPYCPADTIVGVATVVVYLPGELGPPHIPASLSIPLYSLEPAVGEPARFGFMTNYGPVILDTAVATGGDYGVLVNVSDITQGVPFIGSQVTFWGVPTDRRHDAQRTIKCLEDTESVTGGSQLACPDGEKPQPLLIMPTSCAGSMRTSLQADSWASPGRFTEPFMDTLEGDGGEPLVLDGCNRLNFSPSVSVAPDGQEAATPTGLTVDVHVGQEGALNPSGLAQSTVKDTTVTLPAGVGLDPAGADGLQACSLEQIGLESSLEQACPEAAKVGTVEIHTPLLPHALVGAAYLAQQDANPFGSLIALYLVAKDPVSGVIVKLAGQVSPDSVTGQLVSTFTNTPPLPFEDLVLHFFGGSRAPLGTPSLCGSYTTSASIGPWSGDRPVVSSSEFLITSGPNHTPCANPLSFDPELTSGSLNLQAGAFTPFTMTMSREDGQQQMDAIQLHMPQGLSGLLAGVELCPEPQASEGLCGPGSMIGETTVSVGLGSTPFTVKGGKVYITGPYEGAPFGLSIVNPAKAGPFDLENTKTNHPACDCLVVRAKLEVDPITAAITVTSDTTGPHSIPTILEGIPLQIKHVNVTINRPGFTFNPTDCEKTAITGSLTSAEGATSSLSVPFQVTNCATLAFKPAFHVATSAKTSRANGASLNVKVEYPHGALGTQANLRSVKVDLPRQMPSRLTTLQKACPHASFEANPASCPAESVVGHAVVRTQLIPVPLTGPAYFVSYGGEEFPKLIMVLQGYGVTIDLVGNTFIKHGVTSSTFRSTPDTPFESFELTLPEGRFSALAANGSLCNAQQVVTTTKRVRRKVKGHFKTVKVKAHKTIKGLVMPIALTAQNGAVIHQSTKLAVTGCPKAKKAKASRRRNKKRRHSKRG